MEGSSYEIWKDIKDYEGLYQVSNLGNVRSLPHKVICWNGYTMTTKLHPGKFRKSYPDKYGYLHIKLSNKGTTKSFLIHRLVAEAFIPNPNNFPIINHKDENPQNCCVSNLEWCDVIYNNNYGTRNIRMAKTMSNKKKKAVRCIETDIIYNSISDAMTYTGIHGSQICGCCNKKRAYNTAGGYHWEYVGG